jgi:hypothetical protein
VCAWGSVIFSKPARSTAPFGRPCDRVVGSVERGSQVLTKVNPLWPNPGVVIALPSPNALLETGLRMCPPEKSQGKCPPRHRAVHSLQSLLWTKYYEIRACFVYFRVSGGGLSLQFRLRGGEEDIRTLGTGL